MSQLKTDLVYKTGLDRNDFDIISQLAQAGAGDVQPGCALVRHNSLVSDHRDHNREGLERLRRLTALSESELARDTGDGWTVATVLGHLAFFDRMLLLRWDTYERDGGFAELTPNHFELINHAGAGDWSALTPQTAAARCVEAAERAVARIDALSEEAVAVALETNRVALIERMLHWYPHLSQIEGAIGREI